jgi:hypothetical protein
MTDEKPYDLTPEEQRRLLRAVPGDTGTALRLAVALVEADAPGARAVIDELAASDRGLYVASTLGVIAARLAHGCVTAAGGDASTWLHGAAMAVLDEVDRSLDGVADL